MLQEAKKVFISFLFFSIFILFTLPVWALTLVTDLCFCCIGKAPAIRRMRGRFIGRISWVCWNIALLLTFWVRIDRSGVSKMQGAGRRGGRPLYIGANHQSFLDTPLCCCCAPWWLIGDIKTLMARGMMNLPLLGRMAQGIGHMPVPYTSKTTGDFTVDRSQMAKVTEAVDAHVQAGGHLMVFPEGDLNRDWKVLKPFRIGGMEVCIKHDMEVWGFLMVAPSRACWPADSAAGGQPSRIKVQSFRIYPSAKEAAERMALPGADLREQAALLATDFRAEMQKVLDKMIDAETNSKTQLLG